MKKLTQLFTVVYLLSGLLYFAVAHPSQVLLTDDPSPEPIINEWMRDFIERTMLGGRINGLSLGIVKKGRVETAAFGVMNEDGAPVTEDVSRSLV
jgi:hypothetical protein